MTKKHSVTLDVEKCKGCTTCLHICPTKAIRVRNGKAVILQEKCIDCGECIRVCPNHAKSAVTDPLETIHEYQIKIALIPPSLIGQFETDSSMQTILTSIKNLGFDYVYEAAYGAEILGKSLKYEIEKADGKMLISSACPTVVRLIQENFPLLSEQIISFKAPIHITAEKIRKDMKKLHYTDEQVGIFFITPCAAKATEIFQEQNDISKIDGVIAVKDIVWEVKKKKLSNQESAIGIDSADGLRWAVSGGESENLTKREALHVNGIANITQVLEDIENGKLQGIKFLELLACVEGCVGGCLTIENPFVAKNRILQQVEQLRKNNVKSKVDGSEIDRLYDSAELYKDHSVQTVHSNVQDRSEVLRRLTEIDILNAKLPGYDCGSCGCPGCRALAEDVVDGYANEMDCIFLLKDAITQLSQNVTPIMNQRSNTNININKKEGTDENI